MKFSSKIAVALSAATFLTVAMPVQAAVTYKFTGDYTSARDASGNPIQTDIATWTVTLADYITSATNITPASCVTNNVAFTCSATQRAEPFPNGFGPGVLGDYLGLNLDEVGGGSGTGFYFFQSGALGAVGTYSTIDPGGGFGNAGRATLVVSDFATAVPESATWGMMLLGFGLIGSAMRRRGRSIPALA